LLERTAMTRDDDVLKAMTWALLAMLVASISLVLSVVSILLGLGS